MQRNIRKQVPKVITKIVSKIVYSLVLQQKQKQDNRSKDDREVLIQNDKIPFWLKDG